MLKYATRHLANPIAKIFNDALEHHELLQLVRGVLVLIQKPGETVEPLTSFRLIVPLTDMRKTLSLVVLNYVPNYKL